MRPFPSCRCDGCFLCLVSRPVRSVTNFLPCVTYGETYTGLGSRSILRFSHFGCVCGIRLASRTPSDIGAFVCRSRPHVLLRSGSGNRRSQAGFGARRPNCVSHPTEWHFFFELFGPCAVLLPRRLSGFASTAVVWSWWFIRLFGSSCGLLALGIGADRC